jgi:hypothetical protein
MEACPMLLQCQNCCKNLKGATVLPSEQAPDLESGIPSGQQHVGSTKR